MRPALPVEVQRAANHAELERISGECPHRVLPERAGARAASLAGGREAGHVKARSLSSALYDPNIHKTRRWYSHPVVQRPGRCGTFWYVAIDGANTSGYGLGCETEGGGWFASGSAPGKVTLSAPDGSSMEWANPEALWVYIARLRVAAGGSKAERSAQVASILDMFVESPA